MFSKGFFLKVVRIRNCVVKSKTTHRKKPLENIVEYGNIYFLQDSFFHNIFHPNKDKLHHLSDRNIFYHITTLVSDVI